MSQVFTDASAAMHAAYELSKRCHKTTYRHMCLDDRGRTLWVVSLHKDPEIALQAI